jgi:hypothetical protein
MPEDSYAAASEMDLCKFLDIVKFFEPNCGQHTHFWYITRSFADGSNLLVNTNSNRPVLLFDAITSSAYETPTITMSWSLDHGIVKSVTAEVVEKLVHKKEFADAFRQKQSKADDGAA